MNADQRFDELMARTLSDKDVERAFCFFNRDFNAHVFTVMHSEELRAWVFTAVIDGKRYAGNGEKPVDALRKLYAAIKKGDGYAADLRVQEPLASVQTEGKRRSLQVPTVRKARPQTHKVGTRDNPF